MKGFTRIKISEFFLVGLPAFYSVLFLSQNNLLATLAGACACVGLVLYKNKSVIS